MNRERPFRPIETLENEELIARREHFSAMLGEIAASLSDRTNQTEENRNELKHSRKTIHRDLERTMTLLEQRYREL